MKKRFLTAADSHALYECFSEAFSDYQVTLQMTEEQFAQRVRRDGVEMEMSAGAFDGDRMIAFYMSAPGRWKGALTAYDAGTSVVPDHRRRGVAEELFAFMTPRLRELGIMQYLLEVITSNDRAVALYRKLGFKDVRTLAVLHAKAAVKTSRETEGIKIQRVDQPDWETFCTYWDGEPSWQNSPDAIERVLDRTEIVGAFVDEKCVGYGVVLKPPAILMQLAVAPEFRRRGIGRKILATLSGEGILRTNNVDESLQGTLAFYEACGFEIVLRQFEMVREL
ncbi:MAG TPA: GNAT family N-acetyltransferase [Pyrinomonadaceae bacterium]|nr:GNAT family N-acetyltransferase [Pyrinomonadaceae bacterium]